MSNPIKANHQEEKMKTRFFASALFLVVILLLAGCGAEPTAVSTPTETPIPPTPTAALPAYADITAEYPQGTELSCTDAEVSAVNADGDFTFTSGKICPGRSQMNVAEGGTFTLNVSAWITYGVKITLANEVTLDGVTYPAGAKLTVDKDLKWVQVSGW